MSEPVSLILITHNRRGYLEKTLERLLQNADDFRLYCWDNGSTDGVAEIIAGLRDPRVVWRHLCPTNVGQEAPCRWFFEHAPTMLVGKVDDDILLPAGWIEHMRRPLEASERFGMLGCWVFMESDFDPQGAVRNTLHIEGHDVLWASIPSGHSFIARRELLHRYTANSSWGLPLDRAQMTLDGVISGYPLPIAFAHNMDDPRSPHCMFDNATLQSPSAPLTCRKMGFKTKEQYGAWIAADAARRFTQSIAQQTARLRFGQRTDFYARMKRRVQRMMKRR